MIRARSASLNACDGAGRSASGRRSSRVRPSIFQRCSVRAAMPARAQAGASRAPLGTGLSDVTHQGCGLPDGSFVRVLVEARRPFRQAPCPLVLSKKLSAVSGPVGLPRHRPHAVRRDPRSRPAATLPAQPDTDPARGTSRSASPHPSQLWRSTPAVEPPPSSAGCLQSYRQIHGQRSSVAALTPTSRDTSSTDELSGGNSRATILSVRLSVSSHFLMSTPPKGPILSGRQLLRHRGAIAVALADAGELSEVREYGKIANTPAAAKALAAKLGRNGHALRFCYEARPCGYGIQHDCFVVAPSRIPRRPSERIETDRRDAINPAKLHRAGELTSVWVPDQAYEATREDPGAGQAAVRTLRQARQQLSGVLLRHGHHYKRPAWTPDAPPMAGRPALRACGASHRAGRPHCGCRGGDGTARSSGSPH